jgi:hypoxia induced protein
MNALTILVLVAAGAAALSMFQGMVSMAHGGEADLLASHKLMFRRVAWQALAVLLLMFALLS